MLMRLVFLIIVLTASSVMGQDLKSAIRKSLTPQCYVGVQSVSKQSDFFRLGPAVTVLALWPLPHRFSFQVQYIVPLRPSEPRLVRVAADFKVF